MTGNIINIIFCIILCAIEVLIAAGIIIRIIKSRRCAEKRVTARIIYKQTYIKTVVSKSQPPFKDKKYIVAFLNGNKRLTFYVSREFYNRCEINQTGTLIYKGSRVTDFL